MLKISREARDPEFGVAVLGQFRLLRGMSVVRVPRASQRLLAFLALHGRIVERAALAGALWPEASEPHAYSSLRTALARLQRTARMAVAASQFELGLAEGVIVDLHQAKALARRLLDPAVPPTPGDLGTSAVMTLSAGLLPDWYDDWVLVEAEDWRRAIVKTCGSRSLSGFRLSFLSGPLHEFPVDEGRSGPDQGDEVRCVDGTPAVLC
jgi:DNA-binding SARP family transcriptional activator